jgi:hypothetical protein
MKWRKNGEADGMESDLLAPRWRWASGSNCAGRIEPRGWVENRVGFVRSSFSNCAGFTARKILAVNWTIGIAR